LETELKARLGLGDDEVALFHGGLITMEQRNGRIDRYGQAHEPVIRYLVTRPRDPEFRGDLRILDLLVAREKSAHENLGDVQWLMRLHDPEKEEERITLAIATKEEPALVLPELPTATSDGAIDFLALLGGGDENTDADGPSAPAPAVPTHAPRSLFTDDLEYARSAFEELRRDDPALAPEIGDASITLPVPDDLRHRLELLPREMRGDGELELTVDREAMKLAYKKARSAKGGEQRVGWPQPGAALLGRPPGLGVARAARALHVRPPRGPGARDAAEGGCPVLRRPGHPVERAERTGARRVVRSPDAQEGRAGDRDVRGARADLEEVAHESWR